MGVFHVRDSDDSESSMDVVVIPEGFSFQVDSVACGYMSVVLNHIQAHELLIFLQGNDRTYT